MKGSLRNTMFNPKLIAGVSLGALAGFGFYYFVGCRGGACPITGNPYVAALYGALLGYIIASAL